MQKSILLLSTTCTALAFLIACEVSDEMDVGYSRFDLKQMHGRMGDLDSAYLAEYTALEDYLSEPADKVVVEMVTDEFLDIDYAGNAMRSFASPALYFADITPCMDFEAYHYTREEHIECYEIIDCSGVMISPNILMTAGHCPCYGFGIADDKGLPREGRVAKAVFRSYVNLGSEYGVSQNITNPTNFVDEVFDCTPVFEGYRDYIPGSGGDCVHEDLDIAFMWCENNEYGIAPGNKYGFVDYEVDHWHKLRADGRRIITNAYPAPGFTILLPPPPDELLYSIWQNPFYIDKNFGDPVKEKPVYSNPSNTWLLPDDYYNFYGNKLLSEGTMYTRDHPSFPSYQFDFFKIYATHGGSGSPILSRSHKLVAASTTNKDDYIMIPGQDWCDEDNRGMESTDCPGTRRISPSLRWIFDDAVGLDSDDNFVLDLMEPGEDNANIALNASDFYFLPLHDWWVRRGVWKTANLGSLFWNGARTPFPRIRPSGGLIRTKTPFGVLRATQIWGRFEFVFNPDTGRMELVFIPPTAETNVYTDPWMVPMDTDSEYAVVVKYVPVYRTPGVGILPASNTIMGVGSTDSQYRQMSGIPYEVKYSTFFVNTFGLPPDECYINFKQKGAGLTLVENVSLSKITASDDLASKIIGRFDFNNWDDREIWRTYDGKVPLFTPVKEYPNEESQIGWAAVLLPTLGNTTTQKNLTTFYIPLRWDKTYRVSFNSTSNREDTVSEAGVTIEIRKANDIDAGVVSSASVDSAFVGYRPNGYYHWETNTVTLDTHTEDPNNSYYLVVRRTSTGFHNILIDNIVIEELSLHSDV